MYNDSKQFNAIFNIHCGIYNKFIFQVIPNKFRKMRQLWNPGQSMLVKGVYGGHDLDGVFVTGGLFVSLL